MSICIYICSVISYRLRKHLKHTHAPVTQSLSFIFFSFSSLLVESNDRFEFLHNMHSAHTRTHELGSIKMRIASINALLRYDVIFVNNVVVFVVAAVVAIFVVEHCCHFD